LKILFPQKLFNVSFTSATSMVRLLLNLQLLKVMLRCVNDCVTTIKPGQQTTGNVCGLWSDEPSFMLFPTSGRVYVWRTHMEANNSECLVPTVKHRAGYIVVWAVMSW
jgi:hypothetical protein